jgi:hypothetical protein
VGRTITIHFKKEDNAKFSDKEMEQVVNITDKYNSGKLAKVWSCESFCPSPIETIVDWKGKKGYETQLILRHQLNNGDGWTWQNYMDAKIEDLVQGKEITIGEKFQTDSVRTTYNKEKRKYTRMEATRLMVKEGWLAWSRNPKEIGSEFGEFVKVQGNEFNAMLVFLACKELSLLVPKMEIDIEDEGEFLLCPIRMCNGKAVPLLERVKENLEYMALKMILSSGFKGNVLKNLEPKASEFCHEFKMDLGLDNSYGDMTKYINNRLRNLKLVQDRLSPLVGDDRFGGKNELYFQNLEGRDKKKWFEPELFTRIKEVNIRDFVTYKMTPATLMEGFDGSYFNLSNEDSETESYKRIAQMQKFFKNLNIEVLGEENIKKGN